MWDRTRLHSQPTGAGILDLGATIFDPVVFLKPEHITVGEGSRIDAFVKIEGGRGVTIGKGCHISSFCHVNIGGGKTIIEDGAAMSSGAKIISGGNMPDAKGHSAVGPEVDQVFDRGFTTTLKKGSILYTNAVALAGVTVGESSVLCAGGVATKDIPDFEMWGGVPAKFIRKIVVPVVDGWFTKEDR